MNNRYKMTKTGLLVSGLLPIMLLFNSCKTAKQNEPKERHQVMIENKGMGMIYVDKIPCNTVMKASDSAGSNTDFYCYLVGFVDSLATVKPQDKQDIET